MSQKALLAFSFFPSSSSSSQSAARSQELHDDARRAFRVSRRTSTPSPKDEAKLTKGKGNGEKRERTNHFDFVNYGREGEGESSVVKGLNIEMDIARLRQKEGKRVRTIECNECGLRYPYSELKTHKCKAKPRPTEEEKALETSVEPDFQSNPMLSPPRARESPVKHIKSEGEATIARLTRRKTPLVQLKCVGFDAPEGYPMCTKVYSTQEGFDDHNRAYQTYHDDVKRCMGESHMNEKTKKIPMRKRKRAEEEPESSRPVKKVKKEVEGDEEMASRVLQKPIEAILSPFLIEPLVILGLKMLGFQHGSDLMVFEASKFEELEEKIQAEVDIIQRRKILKIAKKVDSLVNEVLNA